jgi:hypothetical protein
VPVRRGAEPGPGCSRLIQRRCGEEIGPASSGECDGHEHRLFARVSAASIGLAFAAFLAGTALAGHWLEDGAKDAGDANVAFDQCNLSDTVHNKFHANDDHDIEPTTITTLQAHSCDIRDVGIEDAGYGLDDPPGWYHCHELVSAFVCDKGEAHINLSYSYIGADGPAETHEVVCEEIGHSVGLGHRPESSSSCLGPLELSNPENHLDGHDKDTLNDNY